MFNHKVFKKNTFFFQVTILEVWFKGSKIANILQRGKRDFTFRLSESFSFSNLEDSWTMGIWFDRLNFRNKKLGNNVGPILLLPKKVTNERELGWARRFYLLSQPWENLLLRVPKPSLLTSYFVFKEPAFLSDEWYFGFHWQLRLIAWERSNVIGHSALKNKAFPARAMLISLKQKTRAFTPTRAKKRKNGTLV